MRTSNLSLEGMDGGPRVAHAQCNDVLLVPAAWAVPFERPASRDARGAIAGVTAMKNSIRLFVAFVLALAVTAPAVAAAQADLPRLEQLLDEVSNDVSRQAPAMIAADRQAAESDLAALRDEVAYLRVKTRRGERVTGDERSALERRLIDLRTRVSVGAKTASSSDEVPVGTEIDIRLRVGLSSKTAEIEDRVEATTLVDLTSGDMVLIPAGSLVSGVVSHVERATRTDRKGSLTLKFDTLRVNNRSQPIRGSVIGTLESEGVRSETGRIGAGAGVGAVVGGILGGVRGAITGILIGGGGVLAATEGKDLELPSGSVLRMRFDSAVPKP